MGIWNDLDFSRNAVIEASAGTGKTYTLEKIVERLVTENKYDICDILLVTFTEKAAGELKERIRKALKGNEASKHLDDATICTIHAFCREVLADYPFESGMMMGMGDVGNDSALYQKAVHNVLSSREFQDDYQEKFVQWMKDIGAEDAEKLMMTVSDKLKKIIQKDKNKDYLRELFKQFENKVKALPGWEENNGKPGAFVLKMTENGETLGTKSNYSAKYKDFFSKLDEKLQIAMNETSDPQDVFRALDFIAGGKIDFKLGKWNGEKQVKINEKGKEENLQFCELQGFEVYNEVKEMAKGLKMEILLHDIVERAYPEFVRLKLRSNSITFDDLIRYTARLVTEATQEDADDAKKAFVKRMRDRYKIALVDEFQDTDGKQWEIFNKLFAAVGHLIVVGDPKQAIYGFRGADLATYLKAKDELLQKGGQESSLTQMYRSTREMVDDFNTIFKTGWFDGMQEGGRSIKNLSVNNM